MPKLTGNRCRCSACGEHFNSVHAFDRHRVGDFKDDGPNRRCLTVSEMQARGWSLNAAGFWITATHPKHRAYAETIRAGDEIGTDPWSTQGPRENAKIAYRPRV